MFFLCFSIFYILILLNFIKKIYFLTDSILLLLLAKPSINISDFKADNKPGFTDSYTLILASILSSLFLRPSVLYSYSLDPISANQRGCSCPPRELRAAHRSLE
jgi:hypothetical protein